MPEMVAALVSTVCVKCLPTSHPTTVLTPANVLAARRQFPALRRTRCVSRDALNCVPVGPDVERLPTAPGTGDAMGAMDRLNGWSRAPGAIVPDAAARPW